MAYAQKEFEAFLTELSRAPFYKPKQQVFIGDLLGVLKEKGFLSRRQSEQLANFLDSYCQHLRDEAFSSKRIKHGQL